MIMNQTIGTLIDPKKKAEILQRIREGKGPLFMEKKPAPEKKFNLSEEKQKELNGKLHYAAKIGDMVEIDKVLAEGADLESRDSVGWTALHVATSFTGSLTLDFLLRKGADIDATTTEEKYTALMLACMNGYIESAGWLVEKGADINASEKEGWTPLMLACLNRQTEIAFLLIEKGADVNAKNIHSGTAVKYALENGLSLVIDKLVEADAK
jgi:death-associated protein kinase